MKTLATMRAVTFQFRFKRVPSCSLSHLGTAHCTMWAALGWGLWGKEVSGQNIQWDLQFDKLSKSGMVSYAKCTLDFIGNAKARDGGTWLTTSAHVRLRQEDPGQSELPSMVVSRKQTKWRNTWVFSIVVVSVSPTSESYICIVLSPALAVVSLSSLVTSHYSLICTFLMIIMSNIFNSCRVLGSIPITIEKEDWIWNIFVHTTDNNFLF